jgi:methylglutaconyl-CoA hydratase
LAEDDAVRVIILGGRGKSFSSGADLNWMKAAGESAFEDNFDDARRLAEMLRLLAGSRKPTIARVHGPALGGGMGLAAACDICVATTQATFATSEVRFGLIPSVISPYVLRAIGPRQALRYFQTGERISAQRAQEIGLVHEAVDAPHFDTRIAKIVENLLHGGPLAMQAAKALVHDIAERRIDDSLVSDTARRVAMARTSPEAKEGFSAFLEKRATKWSL